MNALCFDRSQVEEDECGLTAATGFLPEANSVCASPIGMAQSLIITCRRSALNACTLASERLSGMGDAH
jgi:hypothetical protein